ncbi:hypothetical protein NC653_040396 [Populus alba x Populus x berolinensis]|uniref:Uncharacterized protein n=1 Tax=Populus alba x Populus x berolinensis TaxID=444605 RepID=A0AAD6PRQ0_9ROSI|nr:hypothetical protein NC653_040396 [Populus alba x Populus x berolinensis]
MNWQFQFEQEELKSIQGLQPASTSCKEVTDFLMANSDPLMPTGGGVALVHVLHPIAVERCHAAGTGAAFVNYLHAQIALVAVGHALVPNVRRCAFVAIVKTLVVIHIVPIYAKELSIKLSMGLQQPQLKNKLPEKL